jgi:hypothetical protein
MLTVEGIYKDGKVELLEAVSTLAHAKVLVTFLADSDIDLEMMGVDEAAAADLRSKFATFDDWQDPNMDIYNDYDNAKASLN